MLVLVVVDRLWFISLQICTFIDAFRSIFLKQKIISFTRSQFSPTFLSTRWIAWAKHITWTGTEYFKQDYRFDHIWGRMDNKYQKLFTKCNVVMPQITQRIVNVSCNYIVVNFFEFFARNEMWMRRFDAHFPTNK